MKNNKITKILLIIDFILVLAASIFTILAFSLNETLSYAAGFFVGVTIVAIIFSIIIIIYKSKKINVEYDERQLLIRGKCFQVSFFTLVGLLFADGFIRMAFEYDWSSYFTGVMICVCVSISVYCIMAIFKDAYVVLEKNLFNIAIIMILLCILNLIIGIIDIITNGLIVNDMVCDSVINLICGITFMIVGVSALIKNFINKRENLEE